ncbi:MAG: hypothetical protein ACRDD1_13625 [Planctomycetia bacterium]
MQRRFVTVNPTEQTRRSHRSRRKELGDGHEKYFGGGGGFRLRRLRVL